MNNKRKLRSNFPRRKRQHFSPVLINSTVDDSNEASVKKKCSGEAPVELSECSCVLSNSTIENSTKRKRNEAELAEIEDSRKDTATHTESGISSVSKLTEGTSNFAGSTVVENEECEVESGVKNSTVNLVESDVDSARKSFPENIITEFDLECSENFSKDNFVTSSDESYLYSSADLESSELDSLSDDFTPSDWYESGSQFSEKSISDSPPSRTFQLLNQFSQQFFRSSLFENSSHKLMTSDYTSDDVTLGLDNEEDEENYRMLKSRERRQLYLRDYAAEYCTNEDGKLIIEQRLEMIRWIFEHSTNMELQSETMFLGINLLDRFFSKGYFKTKTSLQLAGIACLTLATRIEENQPYNSIRKKTFYVRNTAYSRCEVVAMEWLVQEVLNFQCFLPTIYNFLWFYLKAARANDKVGKTVGYLATLAMLSHEQMCFWPSTVAASIVILACKEAKREAHCHLLIESHSREKDDTLPECMKRLEWLAKYC